MPLIKEIEPQSTIDCLYSPISLYVILDFSIKKNKTCYTYFGVKEGTFFYTHLKMVYILWSEVEFGGYICVLFRLHDDMTIRSEG